jgi:conjugal transfer pilus assembly protein TraL
MAMSEENSKYAIPHRLDDPPKFLWWDFDVAVLAMGCIVIGIVCNQTLTFMALGLLVAWGYQKMKAGRSKAFGLHAMYWYLPFTLGFKVTPPSHEREFIG